MITLEAISFCLTLLILSAIFYFIVSIPLHEVGHYLFLLLMGANTDNLKINFLRIDWQNEKVSGDVCAYGGFEFPIIFKNCHETIPFLLGLSGGLGSAILMSIFILKPLQFFGAPFVVILSLYVAITLEILYSIYEAFDSIRPSELSAVKFTRRTR